MASDSEIYRMILKLEGEEKAAKLGAAVKLAEQKFKALYDQLGRGDAATMAAAGKLSDLQKQLDKAGGSSKQTGQTLTQLGYVVDDLQAGFRGVANNIQPLLGSIPALAGLAAPVAIASIAVYQLYEHWDKLAGLFGQGKLKTQAEEMDELAKKTGKTADELARLLQLQERQAAAKAQAEGKTPAQQAQAQGVRAAVVSAPYEQARDAVGKLHGDAFRKAAPQELAEEKEAAQWDVNHYQAARETLNKITPGHGDKMLASAIDRLKAADKAIGDDFNQRVTDYLADLERDPARLKEFIAQAKKNPAILGPNADRTLKALEEAAKTPEQREQDKDDADAEKEVMDRNSETAEFFEKKRVEDRDEEEAAEKGYWAREEEINSKRAQWEDHNRQADEGRAAGQLDDGPLAKLAAIGKLDDGPILQALRNLGYSEEEAVRLLAGVGAKLRERGDQVAKDRAGHDGVNVDEARRRIQQDQVREDIARITEIADAGAAKVAAVVKAGGDPGAAQNQLFQALRGKFGDAQARIIAQAAGQRGMVDAEWERRKAIRPSQVIDTAGLADSIQAGVGGDQDTARQQLDELRKANDNLQKIINQPRNAVPILGAGR